MCPASDMNHGVQSKGIPYPIATTSVRLFPQGEDKSQTRPWLLPLSATSNTNKLCLLQRSPMRVCDQHRLLLLPAGSESSQNGLISHPVGSNRGGDWLPSLSAESHLVLAAFAFSGERKQTVIASIPAGSKRSKSSQDTFRPKSAHCFRFRGETNATNTSWWCFRREAKDTKARETETTTTIRNQQPKRAPLWMLSLPPGSRRACPAPGLAGASRRKQKVAAAFAYRRKQKQPAPGPAGAAFASCRKRK